MENKIKPQAIVYTSKTGHTQQYAQMLGEKTGLPVYSLKEISARHIKGMSVIYLGWIHASYVKGYSNAARYFSVCAVCGVGLCDTGTMVSEVRKASSIPESVPLFTMQGGFDSSNLHGIDKLMINMLKKGLSSQKQRSQQEERMLELLSNDGNYVSESNLSAVLEWYSKQQ